MRFCKKGRYVFSLLMATYSSYKYFIFTNFHNESYVRCIHRPALASQYQKLADIFLSGLDFTRITLYMCSIDLFSCFGGLPAITGISVTDFFVRLCVHKAAITFVLLSALKQPLKHSLPLHFWERSP